LPFKELQSFTTFLDEHQPETLNVAGNREERAPGIGAALKKFFNTTWVNIS
jgi:hypothetical protein